MKYDKIAFDAKLKRPGCVLLQAALGCDSRIAQEFPTSSWLLSPTDDLKIYALTEPWQLEALVRIVGKVYQD